MEIIIKLFLTFVKIGAFSFGGGLAMLPFIEKEIVQHHHWISSEEFVDIVAIAQMTPGPIAVNASTFVGYKIASFKGALVGSIGVVIVSFLLMTILAKNFIKIKDNQEIKAIFRGIRPAVLGLILSSAISIGKTAFIDWKSVLLGIGMFYMLVKFQIHPIFIIITAGIIGIVLY